VIDLAHSFGARAVGIGLEKASDATALVSMGCDLGQGFRFGQQMPEERFIALLKQLVTRGCSRARAFRGRSSDGLNSRIDRGTRSMRFTG
jgi:predicted signal transduction protein with EAL and GGDEF domain